MTSELVQQVIRRDYAVHETILNELIRRPCQPRTYICSQANVDGERFNSSYELLREFQVANDLSVPIVRSQRLTARRITVFYCFQKELINSSLKAQLVGAVPEPYRRVVRNLVIRGSLSASELRQCIGASVSARQQALGNDTNHIVRILMQNKIITLKTELDRRQKLHILETYLRLNGVIINGGLSVIKRGSAAQQMIDKLPVDLRRLYSGLNVSGNSDGQGWDSEQDASGDTNVTEEKYVIDYAGAVSFLKQCAAVSRAERLAGGERPAWLLALLFVAINGRDSAAFDIQQLREWINTYSETVLSCGQSWNGFEVSSLQNSQGGFLSNSGHYGIDVLSQIPLSSTGVPQWVTEATDLHLQSLLQHLVACDLLDPPGALGRWGFDIDRQYATLRREVVSGLVKRRHGIEAARVLKFLMISERASLQAVEEKCLISTERCFQILNRLQKDGMVQAYVRGKQDWGERNDRITALYGAPEAQVITQTKRISAGAAAGLLATVTTFDQAPGKAASQGAQAVAALSGVLEVLASVL